MYKTSYCNNFLFLRINFFYLWRSSEVPSKEDFRNIMTHNRSFGKKRYFILNSSDDHICYSWQLYDDDLSTKIADFFSFLHCFVTVTRDYTNSCYPAGVCGWSFCIMSGIHYRYLGVIHLLSSVMNSCYHKHHDGITWIDRTDFQDK